MKLKGIVFLFSVLALGLYFHLKSQRPVPRPLPRHRVTKSRVRHKHPPIRIALSSPSKSSNPISFSRFFSSLTAWSSGSNQVQKDLKKYNELRATLEGNRLTHPPQGDPHELALESRGNPREFTRMIATARSITTTLSDCLQQNLCDQGPKSGFFNPENTPDHQVLNQMLEFLKSARDLSGVKEGFPTPDELLNNFKIRNTETQMLSLELLLKDKPTGPLLDSVLAQAPLVQNAAKPRFFAALAAATENAPAAHQQVIQSLDQSIRTDDGNTVSETLSQMQEIKLSSNEFHGVVQSACRIRSDRTTQPLWPAIRFDLLKYGETHQKVASVDPDKICS